MIHPHEDGTVVTDLRTVDGEDGRGLLFPLRPEFRLPGHTVRGEVPRVPAAGTLRPAGEGVTLPHRGGGCRQARVLLRRLRPGRGSAVKYAAVRGIGHGVFLFFLLSGAAVRLIPTGGAAVAGRLLRALGCLTFEGVSIGGAELTVGQHAFLQRAFQVDLLLTEDVYIKRDGISGLFHGAGGTVCVLPRVTVDLNIVFVVVGTVLDAVIGLPPTARRQAPAQEHQCEYEEKSHRKYCGFPSHVNLLFCVCFGRMSRY